MSLFRWIKTAVSGHGHGCACRACTETYQKGPMAVDRVLLWRLALGAALFVAAWIVSVSLPVLSVILSVLSILITCCDRFIRAVADMLRRRDVDEDILMLLAAVAAVAIGRPLEAAFGALLLQLGAALQGCIREKTRRSLQDAGGEGLPDGAYKTHAEEFIARFTRIYTPIVLGVALLIAVISPLFFESTVREGIHRALILLVIACPCVFSVTIPLAALAGLGAAARSGVILRDTGVEDALVHTRTAVFDQRSMLEGEGLRVVSVRSERMDAEVFLRIAAHACAYSDGEFARSIKAAYQGTIYIELIQSFWQEPGRGITVEVENVPILLGVEDFLREQGVDPGADVTPELSVYLAIDGRYAGRIVFGRVPREDAAAAVNALAWDEERTSVMLSEESAEAAERFARSAGFAQFYADCTPQRKEQLLSELMERRDRGDALLFAGDPAADPGCFAEADVTMAAGGPADLRCGEKGPMGAVTAIQCAKRTRAIVTQNVVGALIFKLLVLGLDMLGACPLWLAVFSDAGLTLAASVNALRALHPPAAPAGRE